MASAEYKHGCPPPSGARQRQRYNAGIKSLQEHIVRLHREREGRPAGAIGKDACQCFMDEYPDLMTPTMEKLILCAGTNIILEHNDQTSMFLAHELAQAVLWMRYRTDIDEEEYIRRQQNRTPDGELTRLTDKEKKYLEAASGLQDSERNVVKFYAKNIPCSCLDGKKKEYAKTGTCYNPACAKSQLDSTLMDCAACQLVKYCSKECQRADWPRHKKDCKWMKELIDEK